MDRRLAAGWVVVFGFGGATPAATPGILRQLAPCDYIAVDLFFILSGMVTAALTHNAKAASP